jgi:hypothetical protein
MTISEALTAGGCRAGRADLARTRTVYVTDCFKDLILKRSNAGEGHDARLGVSAAILRINHEDRAKPLPALDLMGRTAGVVVQAARR